MHAQFLYTSRLQKGSRFYTAAKDNISFGSFLEPEKHIDAVMHLYRLRESMMTRILSWSFFIISLLWLKNKLFYQNDRYKILNVIPKHHDPPETAMAINKIMRHNFPNTSGERQKLSSQKERPSFLYTINQSKYLLVVFTIASFLIPFIIGNYSLHFKNQLGFMDGMAEEYLQLAVNHHHTGKYQLEENHHYFFKPPGYPYFISYALKLHKNVPKVGQIFSSADEMRRITSAFYGYILLVHNILFGLTVLVFFGILLKFFKQATAFLITLLFGCNPYFFILVGLFHYEILHIFLLILGTFLLIKGFDQIPLNTLWLILSGLCFGCATLVRPITLILPVFVFIAFLLTKKTNFIPAVIKTLAFSFCMLIIIAPHTWRNYQLSNTFIPVNAQGNIALWSGTVMALPIQPNHYRWWDLWHKEGMSIYQKVAGNETLTEYSWARHNLELEKEFKKAALDNVSHHPLTYAYNVMVNFISINFCVNSVFLKIFDYIQLPGKQFNKTMLQSDNDQSFHQEFSSYLFTFLMVFLSICSLAGIFLGLRNRDLSIYPVLAVYLCITIAHSITHMDIMYYYLKMPFLFIFFSYFIKHWSTQKKHKPGSIPAASVTFCFLLTSILLFNMILR